MQLRAGRGKTTVRLLFLLKDGQGQPLLLAQAGSQAEADNFGRNHLPEFCGESVELDVERRAEAAQILGVRSVKVVQVLLDPERQPSKSKSLRRSASPITYTQIWVRGPELPQNVVDDDLLTTEDHRDLTLDHIARTSDVVAHLEICKWA
jgi:hypothetical protein